MIWLLFDPQTLQLGPFRWFGGSPGKPIPSLGDKIARHTKGNRDGVKLERPGIRVVNKGQFRELKSMEDVVTELFGDVGPAQRKSL